MPGKMNIINISYLYQVIKSIKIIKNENICKVPCKLKAFNVSGVIVKLVGC